jgi:hypothetical protein
VVDSEELSNAAGEVIKLEVVAVHRVLEEAEFDLVGLVLLLEFLDHLN